jgi:hypothetical protein
MTGLCELSKISGTEEEIIKSFIQEVIQFILVSSRAVCSGIKEGPSGEQKMENSQELNQFGPSYFWIEPLNLEAWKWLKEFTSGEGTWEGVTKEEFKSGKYGRLLVDQRYFEDLVEGIKEAGFSFMTKPGEEGDFKAMVAW